MTSSWGVGFQWSYLHNKPQPAHTTHSTWASASTATPRNATNTRRAPGIFGVPLPWTHAWHTNPVPLLRPRDAGAIWEMDLEFLGRLVLPWVGGQVRVWVSQRPPPSTSQLQEKYVTPAFLFTAKPLILGYKLVDHSDVFGASPVGAAPTTSSFSTYHLPSMDWAKTIARRDEKHLSFGDLVRLVLEI